MKLNIKAMIYQILIMNYFKKTILMDALLEMQVYHMIRLQKMIK